MAEDGKIKIDRQRQGQKARQRKDHFQNQCLKLVASKDKEVHIAVRYYNDALACCVENTIEDRIMDSGASFHATFSKEELEKFRLRFSKKVIKGSLVVARRNKRGSLYMVEIPSDGINAAITGRGNTTLWHQRLGHMNEKGIKILASKCRIPDIQMAVVGFCELCVLGKQKKFAYKERMQTMKEMLGKFIDEGKREHEEMEIFSREFRTTNELFLKEQNNMLSELRIEVHGLSRVMNDVLILKNKVKGVTTRSGRMTTRISYNDEINNINKEPPELEEACTVTINERCSAVLLNKLPSKEKDPESFTIPCHIGDLHINNTLTDLGASISLMPYTMYEKLGLGEPKPTRMSLELADRIEHYNTKPDKIVTEFVMRRIDSIDTAYSREQRNNGPGKIRSEHLYSPSANEIDEKKPELKSLPSHLEYAYLNGDESFPNEILKLLDFGLIYPISHSSWASSIHVVPKKGGMTVILIALKDQEKTMFTCPYGTFAYRRMPFGLCNAPATFQQWMTTIFNDMVEDFMEVFMDNFLDAKPRLIRWVLLLQGFNIEIKDKKGAENLVSNHVSRLKNPNMEVLIKREITDEFLDGNLMMLKAKINNGEPWYADYINYIIGNVVPTKWSPERRKRPTGGNHSASSTGRKVYESGFFWPSIFKDDKDYVMSLAAIHDDHLPVGPQIPSLERFYYELHLHVAALTFLLIKVTDIH
nr:hypothetical protein [Tanacetum cinerariifolium]